jgi:predicted acetyltransferase
MRVYPGTDSYFEWISNHNVISVKGNMPVMLRCVNVQKALQGLPISREGNLPLQIVDSHCSWNSKKFILREENGFLQIREIEKEKLVPQISIEGISALVYGTLRPDELVHYNWLSGISKADLELLNHWFPLKYPWMAEQF